MAHNDLIGFGLLIGYFVAMGLPMILLKAFDKVPFEVARKLYHLVIALSIFPMLKLFSSWYAAVLAALALVLLVYPLLAALENTSVFERIAVEREGGEFKRSLIIIQLAIDHGLGLWRRRRRPGGQGHRAQKDSPPAH